ncbi:unnamed protein product [Ostreobium quekettii]|uniref:RAP domain-containing protein n=1 Tax=Ostreobium quekettii TaxID=121088 RepID=A0A8S1IWR4_9CHLO|nr:unnamed protein product [Ostreobium quekettii]
MQPGRFSCGGTDSAVPALHPRGQWLRTVRCPVTDRTMQARSTAQNASSSETLLRPRPSLMGNGGRNERARPPSDPQNGWNLDPSGNGSFHQIFRCDQDLAIREVTEAAADNLRRVLECNGDEAVAKAAVRSFTVRAGKQILEDCRPEVLLAILTGLSDVADAAGIGEWVVKEEGELLSLTVAQLTARRDVLSAQELVAAIGCFATLGSCAVMEKEGVRGISSALALWCVRLEVVLQELGPEEVCVLVSSLEKLEFRQCEDLLAAITAWLPSKVGALKHQDVAKLAWCLGRLHVQSPHMLLRAISRNAKARLQEFSPNEIRMLLWGLAEADFRCCPSLPVALAEEVVARFEAFGRIEVAAVTWSLARLAVHPGESYLGLVASSMKDSVNVLSPKLVSRFVWSLAMAGASNADLAEEMKALLMSNLPEYKPQEVASFLYSLSVMDALDTTTFEAAMAHMELAPVRSLNWRSRLHIYQAIVHLQLFSGNKSVTDCIPSSLAAACWEAWKKSEGRRRPLQAMSRLIRAAEKTGHKVTESTSVTKAMPFKVTCIETTDGQQVAVELITPRHCFANDRGRLTGPTEWFLRAVEAAGLPVLRLREEEWNNVPQKSHEAYLARKLASVVTSE